MNLVLADGILAAYTRREAARPGSRLRIVGSLPLAQS